MATNQSKSYAAALLWLLLASAFVAALSAPSHQANGFQSAGQFASTVIGQENFSSAAPSLASDRLNRPFRSAFDSSGDMWVADENNHRVVEFKPPFTDGEAASVEIGQPNFTVSLTQATQSSLFGPVAMTFDRSGDLWVSDFADSRVTEYAPPFADGMNASLELGQPSGDLQFVTHSARAPGNGLAAPVDLAFDSSGDLWVADRGNNRVLEYTPPFIDGGSPSIVIGQDSLNASAASTTRSGLNAPESIAFDSSGNLWVVDQQNNRILEFGVGSPKVDGPEAELEIGQPAGSNQFSTNASSISQSGLDAPVGIAFDSSGDLLVSDRANNRILGFEPPFADGMNASFEIGQPAGATQFTSNLYALSQDDLYNPLGISFDSSGNLWVADQENSRVLEFSGSATVTAGADALVSNGGASVDETPTTGIKMDLKGVSIGNLVNLYSADLPSQPPDTGNSGLESHAAYYQAKVSGATGATAVFCVANPQVSDSTDMKYFDGAAWEEADGLNRTVGVSVCGSLPPSDLGSLLLLAVGGTLPASGSPATLELAVLVAAVAVALAGVTYVAIRRRLSRS